MVYALSKLVLWPIISLFIKKIDGLKNLPDKPFIMAANHSSYIDGVILMMMAAWHKNVQLCYFITNEKFTGAFWSAIFGHFGGIRVNGSLEKGLKALKEGKSMGIFPEGGRTYTGNMQKVTHTGLGVMALLSKAPVVPVGMNTFKFWNRYQKIPNFKSNIVVTIGKPLLFKQKTTKANYKKVTHDIMKEVKRLARISNA